jgi:hypothetical protein
MEYVVGLNAMIFNIGEAKFIDAKARLLACNKVISTAQQKLMDIESKPKDRRDTLAD